MSKGIPVSHRSRGNRLILVMSPEPSLSVILISGSFARDDFTIERLPLCDVSLRAPTSLKSFETGIKDALENNAAWQKRISELFHSEHTKH